MKKCLCCMKSFENVVDLKKYYINCHSVDENNYFLKKFFTRKFFLEYFFVVKGISLCVWWTKELKIGGSNVTNVQYANIASQVKFIDTIKYYQQPLSSLAKIADENEKENIRSSCKKLIQNHSTYCASFLHFQMMIKNGF